MEVSGQKGKNIKLCNFCADFDVTTIADGYCVECEVCICNSCFVRHKGRRVNRGHALVKVEEAKSAKPKFNDTFETCQQHRGKSVEFYCENHDQVCCVECIILSHNGCKLELVRNKAVAFPKSSDFKNLTGEISKCNQQTRESASLVETNKQQLTDLHEQFVRDVEAFANDVIKQVNTLKKTLLDQAEGIMLQEDMKMNEIQKDTEGLIDKLSRQTELLMSKMNEPNKLFVSSVLLKPELKKIQQQLDMLQTKHIVTRYSFKRKEILESALREVKDIGQLLEQWNNEQKDETSNADEINEALGLEKKQMGPEKKQPLLERQLICRNTEVDGDILSYPARSYNKVEIYINNKTVKAGDFFEIEILSTGRRGSIALGLVPDNPDDLLPGVKHISIGYHSDGTVYFCGRQQDRKGDAWKVGDCVGCMITLRILALSFFIGIVMVPLR